METLGSYYLEYLVDNFSFTESAVSVNEGLDNDVNHRNGEGTTDFIDINPEELNTDIDAGLVFGVLAIDDASLSGAFMGDYNLLNISPVDQVGISEYVLERQAPKGLAFETIKIFNAGENDAYSFKDYKIENGTYYYRLREISESGFVAVSRIISLEVNMIEVEKADFVIYPNPAKDIVNLNFNQEVNWTRINVWSATGVLVKTIAKSEDNATQELTVNISDLPMGAYYLEVIDNKEETTRKLINVIR